MNGEAQDVVVVTDTSVLVNFLCIDRMDLIARHSYRFMITSHVVEEITDHYPEQQARLNAALATSFDAFLRTGTRVAQLTTSNISAITCTLPSSSQVNSIGTKSGLLGFRVILKCRQVPSSAVTFSLS